MHIPSQHTGALMTTLTIRKLPPEVKNRLRVRAALQGHSMEEEARRILSEACEAEMQPRSAFAALRRHFVDIGGVELELPKREPGREPPTFD